MRAGDDERAGAAGGAATGAGARGARVRVEGVRRSFEGGGHVIDGLDLTIDAGSFVALLGPSGCGKSTLLRLVAGLDAPDAGRVSMAHGSEHGGERGAGDEGEAMASAGGAGRATGRKAFVFQEPNLLPWRDVLSNAALPLELAGVARGEREARAREVLGAVGLGDAAAKMPHELSGGMKMRVSLARALVTRPTLLLLDEPFAALDEMTRQRLDDQLRALWAELGLTVVFVTHSVDEAAYLAERAIVLSSRPARVVLDRVVELPTSRGVELRGEPGFAAEARVLRDALARGGA